jgi:hypothetical protein
VIASAAAPPSNTLDQSTSGTSFGIVPALVWAFRINEDGTAQSLPVDQPVGEQPGTWL